MSGDVPRLYLITPLIADAATFARAFESALGAGDIACVFLQTAGEPALLRRFVPIAQRRGIACLVGDPRLAAEVDADGVHVDGVGPLLEAAFAAMKPERIVGVGGLAGRHEAMCAGETGVDYLMFGGPREREGATQVGERVAWWAEIFNVPCVAYAGRLAEVGELARAGADFVALCDAVWEDPRGPACAVEEAMRALVLAQEQTS